MSTTRRDFLASAARTSLAAVATPALLAAQARGAAKKKRNVLFLAVDDLRPELACYGRKHIHSPNIDALARRGMLFRRAFCQQAVCGATRASLLSGMRPDSSKVHGNNTPLPTVHPDLVSLPRHFKLNGYETISLGKIYHHGVRDDPQGWSAKPWRASGGKWLGRGYLSQESQAAVKAADEKVLRQQEAALAKAKTDAQKRAIRRRYRPGRGPASEWADVPDGAYPDGMTADKAVAELRRLKKGDKPFFLAVGFVKPHLPFNAPTRYWDLYDRKKIRLPKSTTWPKGSPPLAGTSWGELRNYTDMPKTGPVPKEQALRLIHGYYAATSYTDALVGKVLGELDKLGLRDNTVIILWGDHGWKLGEYGAWCKHTNFELDCHVPMILSAPGQKTAGKSTDALVEFVDIYPTLADACGLRIPKHCEGVSMLPLLADPKRPWKSAAFSQYPRGRIMGYSMRTPRFRYTEWVDRQTKKVAARELYDLESDAGANVNAADQDKYAKDVKRLAAMAKAGWKAARPK